MAPEGTVEYERAPVTLDGEALFSVRGVPTYPARERAEVVSKRIRALAADRAVPPDSIRVLETADRSDVAAPGHLLMAVVDLDAESEGIPRQLLAEVIRTKIIHAVVACRADRAPRALLLSMGYAVAATLAVVVLLFLTVHLFRRLRRTLEPRIVARIEGLKALSGDVIQTEPLWMLILGVLATARAILTVVILYFYLNFTLALLPWTRALSIKIC